MEENRSAGEAKVRRAEEAAFRIAGIGASAGGLESLEQFFAPLPAEPGVAFVVIQHLSPDFRSMMSELLARHCRMPVQVVEHETEVAPNHVYLLPPRKEMMIEGGRLLLADKDPGHALTLPIHLFFRSLARDAGARGIGIVLSGSGSDGSRGIREIKRAGGLILVESAESAKFDGMPLSAQATGLVDYTAPPAELAHFLLNGRTPGSGAEPHAASVDESPMDVVLRLLRTQYGLDFAYYKKGTVSRRILRRAGLRDAPSIEDYVEDVQADPDELNALYHDLLIGVTRFFRDPEAFEVLERHVIPGLVEAVPDDDEIRVWVAGCATGEEPYSLAILFMEQLASAGRPFNFKILATDVHRVSLDHASIGLYAEDQLEHVSAERRERFFVKRPGGYQVSQELRQRIVFAPHNVVEDAPFTKMHLITCRNMLIYLEPEAQRTVLSLFHFGLARNGVLFLGSSESTGPYAHEFDAIDEHWRIYRKRRDVRLLDPLRVPVARRTLGFAAQLLAPPRRPNDGSQLLPIYDQLLDEFMPPGLLIDETRALVDTFGGAERLLRLGRRRPSTNVLDLLEGDLRTVVGGALQRVLGNEPRVRYNGVPLPIDGRTRRVTLVARSLVSQRAGGRHVLITFEDEVRPAIAPSASDSRADGSSEDAQDRLRVLESELAYTRETLQTSVEEQQTSNEELQATNEELVASNEELQSTNEELHSVNEELYTVNGEYQKKIIELREVNNDMQHLLEGADNGTLFLDGELRIRKFTPRIASVFHLRPGDVGRSIRDFSHDLDRASLLDEIEAALRGGVGLEDEVRDRHGTTFFLRILPYRPASLGGDDDDSADSRPKREPPAAPEGVMLSVTDISALDRARARIEQLSAIVECSDDAILSKDLGGVITSWNGGAERLYGYSADEVIGRRVHMLAPPGYSSQIDGFLETIRRGERVEHVETMRMRKDGKTLDVSVTISPIRDDGRIVGASAIARDVTQLRQAQRDLEQREARIRLLLDSTAEAIFGLDPDGVCTFCNTACARLLGYASPSDLIGKRIHSLVHHSHADGSPYPEEDCPIYSVLRTGQGQHADDEVLYRADGSSFAAEYWSHPIRKNGSTDGAVVTFLDVTDRRESEEEIRIAARRREHFLAMLSHELRNPLAAVLNASALLKAVAPETPAIEKACGVIDRQGRHMARLLDDLLDVSRITRGGIELRKEDLDLRTTLQLAVEAVTPHIEARRIRLDLVLPETPLPVRGDAARLQQIAGNLLTNAAKYSPEGSRVIVSARTEGRHVVFSVKDEGDGIPAELLPRVFDLFVQNEQGLARSNGGLGVGLALVRQLTELHDGRVEAMSDGPGKGSEFRVFLPLHTRGVRTRKQTRFASRGARRVVIVEDQDDARMMLKDLLESMGYDVHEARDGGEAVEVVRRVHPDVALIDIGLPVLDGYEVARRLRDDPDLNDVVLVALTGYGAAEDIRTALDVGFTAHVTKPADPHRIDEVLHGRS